MRPAVPSTTMRPRFARLFALLFVMPACGGGKEDRPAGRAGSSADEGATTPKIEMQGEDVGAFKISGCQLKSMHYECRLASVGTVPLKGWPSGRVEGLVITYVFFGPDNLKLASGHVEYPDLAPGEAGIAKIGTVGPDDRVARIVISTE